MTEERRKEILRQIRRIEIRARVLADEMVSGEYRSAFKGHGIDFADVREYSHGDDIRQIDWNVTARTGFPHVKSFMEDRELNVILLVDASGSMTPNRELTCELAALLAMSAVRTGDRIGCVVFSDRLESFIPPRKGRKHALRILSELLSLTPVGLGTRLDVGADVVCRAFKRRSVVFLISDLFSEDVTDALKACAMKHDLICLVMQVRRFNHRDRGVMIVSDPEGSASVIVDAFSQGIPELHSEVERISALKKLRIDVIPVSRDVDYIGSLVRLFRRRAQRRWL